MNFGDVVAFGIVGIAAGAAARAFYRKVLVGPLSGFFLKRGKVAWAMKIRGAKARPGCGGDCACD